MKKNNVIKEFNVTYQINKTNRERLNQLQVLRGLAFLGIVVSHVGIAHLGPAGVSIFLILSGFLMVYNYGDKNLNTNIVSCVCFGVKRIKKYIHCI